MGGVTELFFIMIIIAAFAFAPLGYFIYRFTKASDNPLGDLMPHAESPSPVNDFAEKAIERIKGFLAKK